MTWGNPPRSPLPADVWHVPCTPAFRQAHIARGSHCSSLPVLLRRDFVIQWKCPDWETGHFLGSVPVPAPRTVLSRCCAAPSCSQRLGEAERRVPGSDTAPPGGMQDSQKSGNSSASPAALPLHIHPLLSLQPRVGVHVPILGGRELSFLQKGSVERVPARGGAGGGQHRPAAPCWGRGAVSGSRFHNPCLRAVRPHVHRDFTSPPVPLSQQRARCLLAQPYIYTALLLPAKHCQEKKKTSVFLQTSTSCSLARPPRATDPLTVQGPLAWAPQGRLPPSAPALSPGLPCSQHQHH